jgi:hypothetical protein
MPNVVGTPIVNPTYGTPTVAETNEFLLASTTLSTSVSATATTAVLTSAATFSVDDWIIIDSGTLSECVQITNISTNTITVYPAFKYAHTSGVSVYFKVQRQVFALGPNKKSILTTSSPVSITSISTSPGTLVAVINASSTAQPFTISLFDEGASPTGSSSDLMFAPLLGSNQVITLGIPFTNGLAYSIAGTPQNNIIVVWN